MKAKIDELTLLKLLGKGSFGEVYLTKKEGKSNLFATKKMDRKFADQPQVSKYLKNEISILRELNHKNIVKLEDVKVTKNHYYIVMEYCNGGSLSDCLKKYQSIFGHPFTQEIVQYIMRQIINVMKYIHSHGIIHRDLKLDNILVNFDSDYDKNNLNMLKAIIKIIDFGLSTHMGNSNLCYSTVGSPINMDPNILIKMNENKMGINAEKMLGYDQKADIWSLGTICYEMIIGKSAFDSKSMQELINKVQSGTYSVPTKLSKEIVSFLNAMLQFNAKKRLTCDELSRHAFLTKNVSDFEPIDLGMVSDKIHKNNLNINIKRNSTIWSIFNEDDENKLINIPGNYLTPVIKEEEEFNYYPKDNQNNNSDNNQGYGVGYDGINAYENTNNNNDKNNQGYGVGYGGINAYENTNNNNSDNNQGYSVGYDGINAYEITNNNNDKNNQGYGVGYDGINAYENTNNNKNNQGYGFANYHIQQNQFIQNNQNNSPMISPPLIGNVEDESNNYNIEPNKPKIGPVIEVPSFGVPSPGEDDNEKGYEFSSGIFVHNNKDNAYTSGVGGYDFGH